LIEIKDVKSRPNVIRIGGSVYRLDLRGKRFERILQTVSNGKKSLEFPSRAAANRKADEIEKLLEEYGQKKLETLESVMRVDPLELQAKLEPFGKTVQDAVDFYSKHLQEQREKEASQTLAHLMDEWLADKKRRVEQGTLRKATYDTLYWKANSENGYKAQWGNRPIGTITPSEIWSWIEGLKVKNGDTASQVSKQHQLSYLSQFFIWCQKNHGLKSNPCEFLNVERNADAGEVNYYSVEDAKAILELSTTSFLSILPYHCICLFSGVRSTECEKLTWANIDFEDGSIVVPAINAKTGHGRRAQMQPNLIAWLQWYKSKYRLFHLIPVAGFADRKRLFRKHLKIKWLKNGLRHSAASYILGAKIGDYGYLETNFGNSRAMLQQHYLNYPNKEESAKFWAIYPPTA
jgi:integrase